MTIFQIFVIVKICKKISLTNNAQNQEDIEFQETRYFKLLLMYPAAFYFCWFFFMIQQMISIFNPEYGAIGGWLEPISFPFIGLDGLLNSILYYFIIQTRSNDKIVNSLSFLDGDKSLTQT